MMIAHPALGEVNYRVDVVSSDPDEQVSQVIGLMTQYVMSDYDRPELRRDAEEARQARPEIPPHEAVWWYVKDRMRFVTDGVTAQPLGDRWNDPVVEVLIRPLDTSRCGEGCQRIGDCDDWAMYGAAVLKAAGEQDVRFVTVAADPSDPNRYSHVYLVVYKDGARVPLDMSHGQYPGWEVPNQFGKLKEWRVGVPFVWMVMGLAMAVWAMGYVDWSGKRVLA